MKNDGSSNIKATVLQVYVACATEDVSQAMADVEAALNGAVFESGCSVMDYQLSPVQAVFLDPVDYVDGSFLQQVLEARDFMPCSAYSLPH